MNSFVIVFLSNNFAYFSCSTSSGMSLVPLPAKLIDFLEPIWYDRAKCEEELLSYLQKTIIIPKEKLSINERFNKMQQRLKITQNTEKRNETDDNNCFLELEKRNRFLEERVKYLEAELAKYQDST